MTVSDGLKAALCIAHPGHEVRVMEWMRRQHPITDVITDGSGSNRPSRFQSTRNFILEAGGRLGTLQGEFSDRAFYDILLRKDPSPLIILAERLAEEWIEEEIELVAGDMLEGFNPSHDLCRIIINSAVDRVERKTGRQLINLEYPLETVAPPKDIREAVVVLLDDTQFARKRQAALTAYPALASEVDRLVAKYGEQAFQREYLFPATREAGIKWDSAEPPYYEVYGQRQIAAGHYQELITFAEHIQPMALALRAWGRGEC